MTRPALFAGLSGSTSRTMAAVFFLALQSLVQGFGQADRLQAYAEITAWNAPFLQERVHHGVDRGSRNRNRAETVQSEGRDTEDSTVSVNDGRARRGGLYCDIQANVRSQRCAGPSLALRGNQADNA